MRAASTRWETAWRRWVSRLRPTSSCGARSALQQDLANRYDISVSLGIRNGLSVLYVENCKHPWAPLSLLGSGRPHPDCGDGHGTRAAGRDGARERERLLAEICKDEGEQRWPQVLQTINAGCATGVRVASQLWCVIGADWILLA